MDNNLTNTESTISFITRCSISSLFNSAPRINHSGKNQQQKYNAVQTTEMKKRD